VTIRESDDDAPDVDVVAIANENDDDPDEEERQPRRQVFPPVVVRREARR
jgi:hypothetical protein